MMESIIFDIAAYKMWVKSDEFTGLGTNHIYGLIKEYGIEKHVTFATAGLNFYEMAHEALEMRPFKKLEDHQDLLNIINANKEKLTNRYWPF